MNIAAFTSSRQFIEVEFDDLNNFQIAANGAGVPEPSAFTAAFAGRALLALVRPRAIHRRHRDRRA
ncbi:MAG: hypothetical protein FJW31_28875 [Acidobacteria bacterium]|nr:hypothetical protein [Acidobacteriota bacterium]